MARSAEQLSNFLPDFGQDATVSPKNKMTKSSKFLSLPQTAEYYGILPSGYRFC